MSSPHCVTSHLANEFCFIYRSRLGGAPRTWICFGFAGITNGHISSSLLIMALHFVLFLLWLGWKEDLCNSHVNSHNVILGKWLIWMPDNSDEPCLETCVICGAFNWCLCSEWISQKKPKREICSAALFPSLVSKRVLVLSPREEKMPFHHVTAGLLYKGNYLSRSLSDSDSDVLASISVEELDGKTSRWTVWLLSCRTLNVLLKWFGCCCRPFYPIIIGTISRQMKMSRLYWNTEATGCCYCTLTCSFSSISV